MLCGGCSSLSLLAGTLVTPADPFVCHPRLCFAGHPGVVLGVPGAGGCAQTPPVLPCLPPLPGCSSLSLHVSSHRRPQLCGQTRCCSARADQGQEPLKQKPPEGRRGRPRTRAPPGLLLPAQRWLQAPLRLPPRLPLPVSPVSPLYFLCHLHAFGPFSRTPWQETHVPLQSDSFRGFRLRSCFPATGAIPS